MTKSHKPSAALVALVLLASFSLASADIYHIIVRSFLAHSSAFG
jgi:hypothetical protein